MTGFFFLSNMPRDGHITVELKTYRFVFLFIALFKCRTRFVVHHNLLGKTQVGFSLQ